jgi:ATP-dependent DNA ligase
MPASPFPIAPPVDPMLAKLTDALPPGEGWLFEPKWDGFRSIVFKAGGELYIQSRDLKPLNRYFPELEETLRAGLPERCVMDGEIVVAGPNGLDFDALQLRVHPAASRIKKLAGEIPTSFVAFDLLALGDADLRGEPQAERRLKLQKALASLVPRLHLTPCTRDRNVASDWFHRFEGAGFDGVIAKHETTTYQPGRRAMVKVKHVRTADCVVAGFRWHKNGPGTLLGSLLLGLYDDQGTLHHVGVTSAFSMGERKRLVAELKPLRENALAEHPWRAWAQLAEEGGSVRMPGAKSRWSGGKDLSWEPLRVERVCEVKYDHLQGDRFRHAAVFQRWRSDKAPSACRYDQLEVTPPAELAAIFSAEAS